MRVAPNRCARLLLVVVLVCATPALAAPDDDPAGSAAPLPARQRELMRLLKQDCGACHGLRLTGGLGPALTADALRDKPADSLAATIVHGRAGTAMPPWRGLVTEAEADWLVARLQEGGARAR